jgi:hypothetical protein
MTHWGVRFLGCHKFSRKQPGALKTPEQTTPGNRPLSLTELTSGPRQVDPSDLVPGAAVCHSLPRFAAFCGAAELCKVCKDLWSKNLAIPPVGLPKLGVRAGWSVRRGPEEKTLGRRIDT